MQKANFCRSAHLRPPYRRLLLYQLFWTVAAVLAHLSITQGATASWVVGLAQGLRWCTLFGPGVVLVVGGVVQLMEEKWKGPQA